MSDATLSDVEIVTKSSRLAEVITDASRRPRVALDIESNGFHRYPERICLFQLAVDGSLFLIDPTTALDPGPLGELLADALVEKVLHAADYDLRSLDRDLGYRIRNLFDTSIAAAFVGSTSLGLAAVLQEYLRVGIPKSKRLQRSDWTNRPLTLEAQHYAAEDVRHLERVRDVLVQRLSCLSRLEWVAEECERLAQVKYNPPDREWAFASVKGSRTLDGRGLAVLRSLYRFRHREAVRIDRPPFRVIPDAVLVGLASDPHTDLADVKGLGRFRDPPASGRLLSAVRDGLRASPVRRPKSPTRNNRHRIARGQQVRARLRNLKEWRADLGRLMALDPGLLWPAASLERLAASPESLDDELEKPDVRRWQRREFGTSIRGFLATLR
jgi:ribonuclease D